MKFLIATFDHNYYLWQCLVQINNFMKYDYDIDTVYIVSTSNPSPVLKSLMNNNKIRSKFYLYEDTRVNVNYPVTLRHHILEKFYRENPEYESESIFLTDPDVIFTKKIDFSKLLEDNCWYLSDTRSYISSQYIKQISSKLFKEMCDIVKVSYEEIEQIDENAGGAQYLLKNITADFWYKCYIDSEKLYNHMNNTKNIYNKNGIIQSWTADMWAILWNGVYFKHDIKIVDELEFCWPFEDISRWNKTNIFHNAGITGENDKYFSKTLYQNSPFNQNISIRESNCSYQYYLEIKETEKNFKEILF